MKRFRHAQRDLFVAADAIHALMRGGEARDERVGAMLVAEHFEHVRALRRGLHGTP